MAIVLDSVPGDILHILSEMSWDTLLLLAGLAFVAVAVLGNISGKIHPGKNGRIAAAIIGAGLFGGGFLYHSITHNLRVTGVDVVPPQSSEGTCPLTVHLEGVVDVSGSGNVISYFEFSNGNASGSQTTAFPQTGSQIVQGAWQVHETLKDAWVRLQVIAPEKEASNQSKTFSVKCAPAMAPAGGKVAEAVHPPPPGIQPLFHVAEPTNSVSLDSVQPPKGTYLKRGQPITFNLTVSYNLATADSAILSISTAQFRSSPAGCGGGGELTDAVEVPIVRGQHQAQVSVTWSGDTGATTKGRTFGSGYVSFMPMFWAKNNSGGRGERTNLFPTYSEYCYQFGS